MQHFREWIPKTIKSQRVVAGLSQSELSVKAGLSSPSSISHFESGLRTPSIEVLDRIFTALGVTLTLGYEPVVDGIHSSKWCWAKKSKLRELVEIVSELDPDKM